MMSPQKKPAAKSAVQKTSRPAVGPVSGKKAATPVSKLRKNSLPKPPEAPKTSSFREEAISAVGAGTYICRKGKYVHVSALYERMTGFEAAELLGSKHLDHVHPGDRETVRKKLRPKNSDPYEYRFVRKDGDVSWFLETTSSVVFEKAKAMQASVMDITALKHDGDMDQSREQRYQALLGQIEDNYYEIDLKGNFTFVNDTQARNLGVSKSELIGKNYRTYCDAATVKQLKKLYKRLYKTGKAFESYEASFRVKGGQIRFVELSGSIIRNPKGETIGFRGISRDITDRKRMEEQLRNSEERYRSILDATDEGFCELDLEGNVTFVNSAGARIIGYPPERIIGNNFRQYIDPSIMEDLLAVFKNIYKTGRPIKRMEAEFTNKDGIKRYLEIAGAVIRDAQGQPAGFRALAHDITEKKWAEEALLQSEAKYVSVMQSIGVAYFETDLTGVFTFINDRVCADLGYSREELLRMSNRYLQDEVSAQETYAIFNEVYETGNPVKSFQYKAIRRDGTRAIFEISVSLMRDAQGKPIGFRGLSRDITERKRIEDALKASEDKFRKAFMISPDSVVITRLTDNIMISVNSRFLKLTGYGEEEIIGKTSKDIRLWKERTDREKLLAKLMTDAMVNDIETRFVKKSGEVIDVLLSVSMIDLDGLPHALWIIRDITERKEMENALKASEERARTIIATIPDPYYETDLRGRMVYINAAFSNWMGYTLEELRQIDSWSYLNGANLAVVQDLYKTVYKTGLTMKNVEVEISLKTGEKRLVNLSVSLIRNSQGHPTGFHGIARDITEKKKAEELIRQSERSLREYSETLEARVRERTAELEKSKIAAEAASRAKSDFMANISHEFQTPLNAVIGFTKVMQDRMFGPLNEKQEEFLHYIADAGTVLSRIITEILDATHAAAGILKLDLSSVAVVEVLSKTTRMLSAQMEEKHQVLNVDVALDADIFIEADEKKISQIFFHLLNNAAKYTPDSGKIDVSAVLAQHEISGREGIRIAIADTGIGIKPEDIPKLFQTFGTLESPYTRSGKGIGVGLALTKQLVELHGGTISVDSEFGRGSCFTIFLPLKQNQTASAE